MSGKLDGRQDEILMIIADYLMEQEGEDIYPKPMPAIRYIRDKLGVVSTSTVAFHIGRLIEGGWMARGPKGRARLTKKGLDHIGGGIITLRQKDER